MQAEIHYKHIFVPLHDSVAVLNEEGKCVGRFETMQEAMAHARQLAESESEGDKE